MALWFGEVAREEPAKAVGRRNEATAMVLVTAEEYGGTTANVNRRATICIAHPTIAEL